MYPDSYLEKPDFPCLDTKVKILKKRIRKDILIDKLQDAVQQQKESNLNDENEYPS